MISSRWRKTLQLLEWLQGFHHLQGTLGETPAEAALSVLISTIAINNLPTGKNDRACEKRRVERLQVCGEMTAGSPVITASLAKPIQIFALPPHRERPEVGRKRVCL